jgi:hypothetical protein
MKRISAIAFVVFILSVTSHAQGLYSKKNLDQASKEDLSLYLAKAQKLKKTGGVICIAGSSTALVGVLVMMVGGEGGGYAGFYMLFLGASSAVIGIPIHATGSSRIKKISTMQNARFKEALLSVAPCNFYNYQTHNIYPGISLSIRF